MKPTTTAIDIPGTLTDTALTDLLRDTSRPVAEHVRTASADRIDEYRRQIGQLERILQAMDPTIRPQAF